MSVAAHCEHTDKIGIRRKALFPVEGDADSDLGHMSPIHSENSNFSDSVPINTMGMENEADAKFRKFFKCNLDDYILLDRDTAVNNTIDPCSESTMSSLYLSPRHSLISTPILYSPMHVTKILTPLGKSPSSTLKTPHDTSTVKLNQKQTKRKLSIDHWDLPLAKDCKHPKLDSKSKVRTALFPEFDIPVLPAKSFYPKETRKIERASAVNVTFEIPKPLIRVKKSTSGKKRYGEINAGVRHKIKKPKQKKASQVKIVKATMNIIEKSPLAEYLEEMTNVKKTINPIPVSVVETQISKGRGNENNKENTQVQSQRPLKNRKFFKTLRSTSNFNNFNTIDKHQEKVKSPTNQTGNQSGSTSGDNSKLDSFSFDQSQSTAESTNLSPAINKIIDTLDQDPTIVQTTSPKQKSKTTTLSPEVIKTCDKDKPDKDSESINPVLMFSPTSQMCDMASALDLNSPKRAKLNITKMLDEGTYFKRKDLASSAEKMEKSVKMFPLFYGDVSNKSNDLPATSDSGQKRNTNQGQKKFRPVSDDQMLLDVGQKRFGAIECFECKFVYDAGDPMDEKMHENYHNAINTFKFNGWKNERIVSSLGHETKIIKIIPGDSKVWWRKANDVLEYVNRELGFFDGILPIDKSQVYLYIKNKKIVGVLIAEMKQIAHKILSTDQDIDLCSEESYTIRCGISRIWVAPHRRRNGIATLMVDSLRRNFLHGYMLNLQEIAMSSPTELGKQFAGKYFNTENFLIYIH